MLDAAFILLQTAGTDEGSATGIFRFFAAFVLIAIIYTGALSFTYWISKDE
ncbi:MAG: hypothetical protein H0U65_01590 [Rubrobacter sp.]|jgi:hypothetical protein|nr:hypothetical protein [Rubrobacter sp.]